MRRAAATAGLLALLLSGCGGGSGHGSLDTPLSYMPAHRGAVAVVSTDLGDSRYDELNGKLGRRLGLEGGLRDFVRKEFERMSKLSWEDDVEPGLGNDAAIGVEDARELLPSGLHTAGFSGAELLALELRDEEKGRTLLEKVLRFHRAGRARGAELYRGPSVDDEDTAAIDDGVLVAATSRAGLLRALARHQAAGPGGHLTAAAFDAATREAGSRDALVRGWVDPHALIDVHALRRLDSVDWVTALRSAGVAFDVDGDNAELGLALNTGPGLRERDLPLAVGKEPPRLLERPGEVAAASANQSQTTAFLLRAAEQAFPRSAFVFDVADVEHDLKIDFEQEFLRQFDGPSASTVGSSGAFAARSTVRDPARMAKLLRRLAPRLPQLVLDLQALGSKGLSALFLFAPDAPVSTREFSAGAIGLRTLPGGLYSIEGLTRPSPPRVVFGVVGKVFVVASDETRAREVATAPTAAPPAGLSGAAAMRGDLGNLPLPARLSRGEATGSLDATPARLLARLRMPVAQLAGGGP